MGKQALFFKKHFKTFLIFVLIFLFLVVFDVGCFFKFFTGIPCPSCGITRAYISLLRLDLKSAFYYHPLFPVFLPAVLIMMFMKQPFFNSRIKHYIFLSSFLLIVLAVWIIRVFFIKDNGFDIDFSQSFVIKLYHDIIS